MAEVINGTSGNDRLTAITDTSIKAGAGDDTINIAGAQNVTIETGSGKDEIVFPYEGYDNPSVTFTDFDPQNDVLNFPEWAFFYKNYYFRTSVENGNLVLKDGLNWYTLTFRGVTSTNEIKDTLVKKWNGYSGKLGGILYNTISGSSSHDTNQSVENVINLTNGNDTFSNSGLVEQVSNVRIEALAGDDTISNGVNGQYVIINGGAGNDSLYNNSALGNVTINGDAGNDIINNHGSSVSIYAGDGSDNIGNFFGHVTIDGGNGNDYIINTGSNDVIINGGNDNDTIVNFAQSHTIKNVTIIGGKGNDSIVNYNMYDYDYSALFVYNAGDGDDIIQGFNTTSTLSISGSSYSSVTSGNDVIISVGDGSITLKDATITSDNIIFTHKDDTDDTIPTNPDNPSSSDDTISAYDDNTKTWTIYNGYGDEAVASDYNTEVKNIIATGRNKSIKITGNELDNLISGGSASDELFGESGSDTVHGNSGNDKLHGGLGNDALYGGEGNDEIHGDSGNDELYGGVGNDILFGTDGKNTLDGGKDSDTMVGGKGEDIFVHKNGNGNDLILDYNSTQDDKLKFEDELIEDVKVDGTDVIITTENGEKLTVKYAAGQEISYINTRGNTETIDHNGNKPKSADSIYIKATRLMNSATKTVNSTKSTAANTLYDSTKTEANFAVNELKKSMQIHTIKGGNLKKSDIPNSVYEKISEELLSAFNGSMIDHYEYGNMGSKLIKQIANQISSGFIDSTSVVTDEKTRISYTVSNSTYAMSGAMVTAIRISWSNKEVMLTWTNINKESGQIGFANYLKNLSDLNKEVWKDFVAAWLSPITGKNTRSALDFAEKIIEALCYKDDSKAKALVNEIGENYIDELKSDLNERFTNSAQKLVRKFISKYIPKGNEILNAVDKIKAATSAYDELKEKYISLVEAIEDYNNLANTGDFLALEKDYNTVENLYNTFNSAITYGINTDDTSDTIFDKIFEAFNSILGISKANVAENIEVTDINSLDDLAANGTSVLTFTEISGSGIQNVNLRSSEYPQIVSLEGGNQNVQFNDKDGNVAIAGESATGSKEIIFGNGDALGIFYSPDSNINATVGSGKDSILVDNNARVHVDITNADNTTIALYSGKVSLDGYDASTRSTIFLPDVDNIIGSIKDNSIRLVDDAIRLDSGSVKFNSDDDSTLVNIAIEDGSTQKIGFTSGYGGAIDASDYTKPLILVGNMDGNKGEGSELVGGSSNDTVLAGAGDTIKTNGGKNIVQLQESDSRDGAVVNISGGRTTITGSNNELTYFTGDTIAVDDLDITTMKFTFAGESLIIKSADFHTVLEGVDTLAGNFMTQYITNTTTGITYKTAIGAESSTMYVAEDEETRANAFIGKNSKVDFSNFIEDAIVDLGEDWSVSYIDGNISYFEGVNQLNGGEGDIIFKGSDAKETLTAGKGNTSLYGDGGRNILNGYTGSDKEGQTTFIVLGVNDGAVNTISGFEFVSEHNYINTTNITADMIEIDIENNHVSNVAISGDNILLEVMKNDGSGSTEKGLILDAMTDDGYSKDFVVSGVVAQVGHNHLNFDKYATFYLAKGENATIEVDSSIDNEAILWLDDPDRGVQFEGDFHVIDAQHSKAVIAELAGNNNDNTIYAGGQGSTSLWGGNDGNDLLIGGNGVDSFYYVLGNGNDTIQNISNGDSVLLANVSLDQIVDTNITASSVSIRFNDGGSLRIDGTADFTYLLSDGSKYFADHKRFEWNSK